MASASIASHHTEWLSLVEVSGPFLSLEVLTKAFPQGLPRADDQSETRQRLSSAYEEWLDNQGGLAPEPAIHRAWLDFVLREIFEWDDQVLREGQALPSALRVSVAEHGVTLAPTLSAVNPNGAARAGRARVLVMLERPGQGLDKALEGDRWKASPATRMATLLHATEVRLGLVTNGEHWMLVHAALGETTTYASFYASLFVGEEPLTLRALASLLDTNALWAREDGDTTESLFERSKDNQHEVTDQLGSQVRRAVETLIQCIDRIDRDRARALLRDIPEQRLYEAAVTVMMRLVFLLCAEERGLLLLGDPLYDQHYALSTLRDQLQEQADRHGSDVLERRHDAFARLLATFRAVHGGVRHDHFHLPAYGGSLFDPDRFPFLEGREPASSYRDTVAAPLPIDNLTVLDLLNSLTLLEMKLKGAKHAESRRVSFRALDVEQIGHVYEGLLDHTAKRARGPVLGLAGTKDKEPEIPLTELNERVARDGEDGLVKWLEEQTGRGTKALAKCIRYEIPQNDRNRWLLACENDRGLYNQATRWAGLIREDAHERPVVFGDGAVYVTAGTDRRSTGTHYTPRSLTEPIVQHTLEPLVYEGPAEGKPKEHWKLKPASVLLKLKVCDMAMGSGAFLVEVCRYLSERVVEAWEAAERESGGKLVLTPEGELTRGDPRERVVPRDTEERLAIARRVVADRCLYGVDKNPMAVEMAKLSLWLVTLQKDKPFTFVDHALRCGDSLLGLTGAEQIQHFHIDPSRVPNADGPLFRWAAGLRPALERANALRKKLESFTVDTLEDGRAKQRLLLQANAAVSDVRLVADLVIAVALAAAGKGDAALDRQLADLLPLVTEVLGNGGGEQPYGGDVLAKRAVLRQRAADLLNSQRGPAHPERRPFHWVLEFPEVVGNEGFDAFLGNPPFMGGLKLDSAFGTTYRALLVERLAAGHAGVRGTGDLSAYFVVRALNLLRDPGTVGLITTNTIAQGDTRTVALERLVELGASLVRAVPSLKWPGAATIEVALIWLHRGRWSGGHVLSDRAVTGIAPTLSEANGTQSGPERLAKNRNIAFTGAVVFGKGFFISHEDASALLATNPALSAVLRPYLTGEDFNTSPTQAASRWVINFRDWPLSRDSAPEGYRGPVAEDYPECLRIVDNKVKPQRLSIQGNYGTARQRRTIWWRFSNDARNLYKRLAGHERALTLARVSKHLAVGYSPVDIVHSEQVVVFAADGEALFPFLQSSFHTDWVRLNGSSMKSDIRYAGSACFETFPIPASEHAPAVAHGREYEAYRASIMLEYGEGLTKVYNRFHSAADNSREIQRLRNLHVELDRAVARAYGWNDLELGHGFHKTRESVCFTPCESVRREILSRLLLINHAYYAEELKQGLHGGGTLQDDEVPEPTSRTGRARSRRSKSADEVRQSDFDFEVE